MQLVIDKNLIDYQLLGKGDKTILLVHGWTANAHQSFEGLATKLAEHYQVVMPDLPGFGKSPVPPLSWGVSEYAQFLQKFLDKLGLKPEIIIAHSNGGTLALYGAAHDLLKSNKLVLLGSAGIRSTPSVKKTSLKLAAKPVKMLLKTLPTTTQERIKKRAYSQLGSDLYVLEHMKPIFKRVVQYDIRTDANRVKVETLLIYGINDTSTPPQFGQLLKAAIPDARLELIDDAGHYVHLDQAEKTYTLIKDFCNEAA